MPIEGEDDAEQLEPAVLHQFKNHLTVILGFCELLLHELPEGNARDDVAEIHKAGTAAMLLIPTLAKGLARD